LEFEEDIGGRRKLAVRIAKTTNRGFDLDLKLLYQNMQI